MTMQQPQQGAFSEEHLLISRTDKRGVIQAANLAFSQVSGLSMEELVGAPHRIVRHPDMPKGIFWLLWDYLKQDRPVAAYVKNSTKEGGHYWVFATISPLDGGHMSMRVKPDAPGLRRAQDLYEQLLLAEREEALTPEQSAARFVTILQAEGHSDYPGFMAQNLAQTQQARSSALDRPENPAIKPFREITQTWQQVKSACDQIGRDYADFGGVSTNLQVQAGHLKGNGIALGAVSSNFSLLAAEINNEMRDFVRNIEQGSRVIDEALFLICLQDVMEETQAALAVGNTQDELGIIKQQNSAYKQRSIKAVKVVSDNMNVLFGNTKRIERNLSGLSVTRVMCAIENAQIARTGRTSVTGIIHELQRFQDETDSNIRQINGWLGSINLCLKKIVAARTDGAPDPQRTIVWA